jgi:hypothetical protein
MKWPVPVRERDFERPSNSHTMTVSPYTKTKTFFGLLNRMMTGTIIAETFMLKQSRFLIRCSTPAMVYKASPGWDLTGFYNIFGAPWNEMPKEM